MKISAFFVMLGLLLNIHAESFVFGEAVVKSVSLEKINQSKVRVDMGTTRISGELAEYLVVRIDKERGRFANVEVIDANLAYCKVIGINQSQTSTIADAIISFEVENDGGFNSCIIEVSNGKKVITVEISAEVGE